MISELAIKETQILWRNLNCFGFGFASKEQAELDQQDEDVEEVEEEETGEDANSKGNGKKC